MSHKPPQKTSLSDISLDNIASGLKEISSGNFNCLTIIFKTFSYLHAHALCKEHVLQNLEKIFNYKKNHNLS